MRILLSNDDGVFAPGLAALREAVEGLGQIAIAAPASPQSAAAHAITLWDPLAVRKVELPGPPPRPAFSVDGRPADCVRLAIRSLLDSPPDLVLSGINLGANVGINVFYSGTVAAAAEAAMLGFPAVAMSAVLPRDKADFVPAARICRWVLEKLLADGLTAGDLININVPDPALGPPRGVRVAAQSTVGIDDAYHVEPAGEGVNHYRLGEKYEFLHLPAETDAALLAEGYVTVTPLHVDMTNHDRLAALARRGWGELPGGE